MFSKSITKEKEMTDYMRNLGENIAFFLYRKFKSSHYVTWSSRKRFMGAGEMARSEKCLPRKQEDMSSDPQHRCRKPSLGVGA